MESKSIMEDSKGQCLSYHLLLKIGVKKLTLKKTLNNTLRKLRSEKKEKSKLNSWYPQTRQAVFLKDTRYMFAQRWDL